MQVVIIARRDNTDPSKLSWRSVTVAIPTPSRRMLSESWILRLQCQYLRTVKIIYPSHPWLTPLSLHMDQHTFFLANNNIMKSQWENVAKQNAFDIYLNFFPKNAVSKKTVQGIIASFVIWAKSMSGRYKSKEIIKKGILAFYSALHWNLQGFTILIKLASKVVSIKPYTLASIFFLYIISLAGGYFCIQVPIRVWRYSLIIKEVSLLLRYVVTHREEKSR